MTGIQIVLLGSTIFLAGYFILRLRNRVFDLVFFLFLMLLAVVLVLFPHLTQLLADTLGVGRGADLVFYLCIVLFGFLFLKLYTKVRRLESWMTEQIRKEVIDKESTK